MLHLKVVDYCPISNCCRFIVCELVSIKFMFTVLFSFVVPFIKFVVVVPFI
jgi:hypothetical protein